MATQKQVRRAARSGQLITLRCLKIPSKNFRSELRRMVPGHLDMERQVRTLFMTKKETFHRETPYFLYFDGELKKNIEEFRPIVDVGGRILYALKSNNHPRLVERIISEQWGFDIASRQELDFVLEKGANPDLISCSNTSLRGSDIEYISRKGVGSFVFDTEGQIRRVRQNSAINNCHLVARIDSASDNAAFNLSSKFGMPRDYLLEIVKKAKYNRWNVDGLAFHVGSQNLSLQAWAKALDQVRTLIHEFHKYDLEVTSVNLGGGIPAQYHAGVKSLGYYVAFLKSQIETFKGSFPEITVYVEPGRSVSASTMALVSTVVDVKPYELPPMIILDTSVFHGLIEALEGFEYPVFSILNEDVPTKEFQIAGNSCDAYDIIKKSVQLPMDIASGDILVFAYAGAYTFVYENFHMVPYAPRLDAPNTV